LKIIVDMAVLRRRVFLKAYCLKFAVRLLNDTNIFQRTQQGMVTVPEEDEDIDDDFSSG